MASLSDILTAAQNLVVATNNVAVQLTGLLDTANPAQLYAGQLPTSVGVLFTSTTGTPSALTVANFCNTSGGALTYNLYIVPAGGTAGASNAVIFNKSLGAADFVIWQMGLVIPVGATLQGSASAAGITLSAAGRIDL